MPKTSLNCEKHSHKKMAKTSKAWHSLSLPLLIISSGHIQSSNNVCTFAYLKTRVTYTCSRKWC